ncbi:MAG TPA: hypothetical protein ENJ72_04005 [Thermodesulfatator sp.]|nr:hypothetical protein [Thermodesulfatator sp.]
MARRKVKALLPLFLLFGLGELIKAEGERQAQAQARARRRREALAWEELPLGRFQARIEQWEAEKMWRWEIIQEAALRGAKKFVSQHPLNVGWEEVKVEILSETIRRLQNSWKRGWNWRFVPLKDLQKRARYYARKAAVEPRIITNLTFRPYVRVYDKKLKRKVMVNYDLFLFSTLARTPDGEERELTLEETGGYGVNPEKLLLAVEQATGNLAVAWA